MIRSMALGGSHIDTVMAGLAAAGLPCPSRATVHRRMMQAKAHAHLTKKAAPKNAPIDPARLVDPDDTSNATLALAQEWVKTCNVSAAAAESDGNADGAWKWLDRLAKWTRIRDEKQREEKAPDPNANPDMVAAGDRHWEELDKLCDRVSA